MRHSFRAVALLGAIAVAGCGAEVTPSSTSQPLALNLSASATEFVPELLTAPAGTPVRVAFSNGSNEPHTLIFPEPISVNTGQLVQPGETITVDLTTPTAGEYAFLCNVHEGMTGILRVN